jgi:hypothetical protein
MLMPGPEYSYQQKCETLQRQIEARDTKIKDLELHISAMREVVKWAREIVPMIEDHYHVEQAELENALAKLDSIEKPKCNGKDCGCHTVLSMTVGVCARCGCGEKQIVPPQNPFQTLGTNEEVCVACGTVKARGYMCARCFGPKL